MSPSSSPLLPPPSFLGFGLSFHFIQSLMGKGAGRRIGMNGSAPRQKRTFSNRESKHHLLLTTPIFPMWKEEPSLWPSLKTHKIDLNF
jgi:hypothetical protein